MHNDNLQLHDARPEELDAVASIIREAYRQYEHMIPDWAWERYIKDITDVRSRIGVSNVIVAVLNGEVAGTVTLYLKSSPASLDAWPLGWAGIRILAVHPRYRGKGIGRALMDECVRRCRENGIKTIGLHTTEAMDIARKMYEKMGFTHAPEFDFRAPSGANVMAYRFDL